MKIDGHYDQHADIAWLRFDGYDSSAVVAEQTAFGLREVDPVTKRLVGLEYWRASEQLPAELLQALPAPSVDVTR